MLIKWKIVTLGVIVALILAYIIPIFTGLAEIGAFIGFLIGTVYVGYAVGANLKEGALNGLVVGFLVIIISLFMVVGSIWAFMGMDSETIFYTLYAIIFYIIAGAIAGFIGSLIKRSRTPKGNPTSN
jgi:hypothetical protein